jgi:hypothetical protein
MAEYWRQRGKFDVPNERFISYPLLLLSNEIIIGWAGWDYSEQARVLVDLIEAHKRLGNDVNDSAIPLLAGLLELLPWLQQRYKETERSFWESSPAEAVSAYLEKEQNERGLSSKEISAWRPPKPKRGRPPKGS